MCHKLLSFMTALLSSSNLKPWSDSYVTFREIFGQLELWRELTENLKGELSRIEKFLQPVFAQESLQVVFAGAGSSAFVGEATAGVFQRNTGFNTRAIPTTDLVTHPLHFIQTKHPLLLVSFARSGNSPESVAAVERVNQVHPEAYHLILTCNSAGALAQLKSMRICTFLLPKEANDQGLAMVGSVTGMILVSLLLSMRQKFSSWAGTLSVLTKETEKFVLNHFSQIQRIAEMPFERVVCLGSGEFLGLARESHLKIQELSDGQVICKHDSYLGFRHGPKAVVNERTLLIYFLSTDPNVVPYERDLIASISKEQKPLHSLVISAQSHNLPVDTSWRFDLESTPQEFLLLPYLVPVQILAALHSKKLNLNPDSPSARGAIHRVVQGVAIYPFQN